MHVLADRRERSDLRVPLLAFLRRYAAQDLSAKAAVLAGGAWMSAVGAGETTLVLGGALLDLGVFYAVTLLRERRAAAGRSLAASLRALALEYGPAELCDLAVRPTAMGLALASFDAPAAALLAGSLAADVVFYLCAAVSRRVSTRSRGSA